MTSKERKHTAPPRYDEAFKAGAVRMVIEQGRPSREVAKELGICIDTNLTLAALDAAVRRRHPSPGLIFHSDRSVQYAACAYRLRLANLGIRQSMSRKGDPYDNAVAENFFSRLKRECVHLKHFASRNQAKADILAYIEVFYNSVRPHSSIGWQATDAFARSLSTSHAA